MVPVLHFMCVCVKLLSLSSSIKLVYLPLHTLFPLYFLMCLSQLIFSSFHLPVHYCLTSSKESCFLVSEQPQFITHIHVVIKYLRNVLYKTLISSLSSYLFIFNVFLLKIINIFVHYMLRDLKPQGESHIYFSTHLL